MNKRTIFVVVGGLVVLVIALALAFRLGGSPQWTSAPAAEAAELSGLGLIDSELPLQQTANDRLILSYAAKFVCTSALPPGTLWYDGLAAPIVNQETQVLIYNPHAFDILSIRRL